MLQDMDIFQAPPRLGAPFPQLQTVSVRNLDPKIGDKFPSDVSSVRAQDQRADCVWICQGDLDTRRAAGEGRVDQHRTVGMIVGIFFFSLLESGMSDP